MSEFETLMTMRGEARVNAIAYSCDGHLFAMAYDDQIKIISAYTGEIICTLEGHDDKINVLSFSQSIQNGNMLASGSKDCCCVLWNFQTLLRSNPDAGPDLSTSAIFTFLRRTETSNPVISLAFASDHKFVASASINGVVTFVSTGAVHCESGVKAQSQIHTGKEICSLAMSSDNIHAILGYSTGRVEKLQTASGALVRSFRRHMMQVATICFSPDGLTLATGSWDRTVKLSSSSRMEEDRALRLDSAVFCVAFSPTRPILACGVGAPINSVILWDLESGARARLSAFQPAAHGIAFSPDGASLAFTSPGSSVVVRDLNRRGARLALAMALHPRLGADSILALLEPALISIIARYLLSL